ncbi:MAG: HD domain-containing protein [Zestosphaera sp.]
MVTVGPTLVLEHVGSSELLRRAYEFLEQDEEVQTMIKMSNIMAVSRLKYNDHGVVHSRIVSGSALELLKILLDVGLKPSTLTYGTVKTVEEAKLVVLTAAYLHDIGNSVHRSGHEYVGALLAKDIIDRMLREVAGGLSLSSRCMLRHEIMHAIYATETSTRALTVEAGIVKVADGTDMAEGRARIPYRMGKLDMHSVSATSVKKVELSRGSQATARIDVYMTDSAGLFQIEAVLKPKILTSGFEKYLEVFINVNGKEIRVYPD